MAINDTLLNAIKNRGAKQEPFEYGILTADRWVLNLQDQIGLDNCYKFACKDHKSFGDVLVKAANTLTYSNKETVRNSKFSDSDVAGIDLPKNTLMVFRHILTSSNKDRDGDILRSNGMDVDPSMLLLWQHVHTLPIGKAIKVLRQDDKSIEMISAIVDMNELCHDAAVMVDNGMGRFSHGFRALEFEEIKSEEGNFSGFDITKAEIMEESLVSVPANIDAETQEIMLSLVDGGKLTSPMMKEYGKNIRENQKLVVPGISYNASYGDHYVEFKGSADDLNKVKELVLIGSNKDEDTIKGTKQGTTDCSPEKANDDDNQIEVEGEKDPDVQEVEETNKDVVEEKEQKEITVEEACSVILNKTTEEQKRTLIDTLNSLVPSKLVDDYDRLFYQE